jgi:hypothetical protein
MPPRYAYWTILIDNAPTAFRAREKEDLLPTLNQLRRTNKDVVLKWFGRGKLWDSPEAAQAADRAPAGAYEKRGRDWRPGGTHKDPRDRFKKGGKRRDERAKLHATAGNRTPKPRGTSSTGAQPWRDKPRGTPPAGAQPWRDKPRGTPPAGAEPWRNKPRGTRPAGAQPWRDKPRGTPPGEAKPWRGRPDTRHGAGAARHHKTPPPSDAGSAPPAHPPKLENRRPGKPGPRGRR